MTRPRDSINRQRHTFGCSLTALGLHCCSRQPSAVHAMLCCVMPPAGMHLQSINQCSLANSA